MPKEDYLIKYLQKIGLIIAAMMGFRKRNQPDESIRLADEVYKELLSINIDDLLNMDNNSFNEMILKENYNASYLESLAKLSYEMGKAYGMQSDKKKETESYRKTLLLYQLLNAKDKTFSFEREEIISHLKSVIKIDDA